jgi:hypothetical protein
VQAHDHPLDPEPVAWVALLGHELPDRAQVVLLGVPVGEFDLAARLAPLKHRGDRGQWQHAGG